MTETDLEKLRAAVGKVADGAPGRLDILDHAQFSISDAVATFDGLGMPRLQQWIAQGWLPLSTPSAGQGRRRLITGADMLLINAMVLLSPWLPLEVAKNLAPYLRNRAFELLTAPAARRGNAFYLFPAGAGQWAVAQDFEDGAAAFLDRSTLPMRSVRVDVDALILSTVPRLQAIIAGTLAQAAHEQYPAMSWDHDEQGRPILTGLTFEESREYRRLTDLSLESKLSTSHDPYDGVADRHAATARYIELHGKHEGARLAQLGQSVEARYQKELAAVAPTVAPDQRSKNRAASPKRRPRKKSR